MESTKCPSCGASMRITTVGAQRDRVLLCDYCSHQVDLVDEVTRQESEETGPYRDANGNIIQSKRVTITTERYGPASSERSEMMGQVDVTQMGSPPQDIEAQMAAIRNVIGAQMGSHMADQINDQLQQALEMREQILEKGTPQPFVSVTTTTLQDSRSISNMGRGIIIIVVAFAVLCGVGAFMALLFM